MSDLISRSVFNEKLLKIECESSDKNYRNGAADMLNVVFQLLNNQPTAYDVEKVVEQLEEKKNSNPSMMFEADCWRKGIDDAIDIVRGGRE